jgi:hypothetical protein
MGISHGEYPGVETRKSGALSGAHRVRLDSPPHARDQAWRLRAERMMITVIVCLLLQAERNARRGRY